MPPHRFNSGDEVSLRHLPDTSDASFSFQIPNALSGSDRLLDEDDMSFFRDSNGDEANTTMAGPSRTQLFTLDELTPHRAPKPDVAIHSGPSSQPAPTLALASNVEPKPKPSRTLIAPMAISKGNVRPGLKAMTQHAEILAEAKSSATKLETLRAEVHMLNDDAPTPSQLTALMKLPEPPQDDEPRQMGSRRERVVTKPKRAIISGGITKPRSKGGASSVPRNVASAPAASQQTLPPLQTRVLSESADFLQKESPDTSICSTAPGGVAERLVMYGQTLLTSFGPPALNHPETFVASVGDPDLPSQRRKSIPENVTTDHINEERDDTLTLSQLSPSKVGTSPHPTPPATDRPGSPMRQSTKRPASVTSTQPPVAKKGRGPAVASDNPSASIIPAGQGAGSQASAKSSSSSSASRKGQRTRQRTRDARGLSKPTRQEPEVNASQGRVPPSLARTDASASGSDSSTLRLSQSDNLATSGSSTKGHEEAGLSRGTDMPLRLERIVLPPANPTKSVEFKFQVEARIEARKAEFEKEKLLASQKSRKQNYHQVPDFKTIHAAEEARLALRKENIVPVVPLPLQLNTDERAREREKFEEHLREKERELERAIEQKRRENEENEEREIRELRKKAIPRAHEVPEWYKEVPKKNRDGESNRG
ncbi:hypothetical protein DXG01_015572 [Tephrocybe rancida]|nr:hypothetical protein DXG01_015572 [Tephrocybe rancida]